MKALSVKKEYVDQMERGEKTMEIRKTRFNHRGPLLICSTQPEGLMRLVVEMVDCHPFTQSDAKAACSKYRPGLFAWVFATPRRAMPAPVRGQQGIFNVDDKLVNLAE